MTKQKADELLKFVRDKMATALGEIQIEICRSVSDAHEEPVVVENAADEVVRHTTDKRVARQ